MTQLSPHPGIDLADLPLPPGPRGHWLLGNLQAFSADVLGFMQGLAREYGPVARTRYLLWDAYFISHPDGVQQVLQGNHRNYTKEFIEYKKLAWVVGNGLLTSEGEFWLRQRRLAAPAFHRRRVMGFAEAMRRAVDEMLDRWDREADGAPADISKEMMQLTLRIVSEALFSFNSSRDAETVDQAFSLVNEYIGVDAARPFSNLWRHLPTARNRAFNQAIAALDEVVHRIINQRRRQPELLENGDLLSMLMQARDEETGEGMSDAQLRDEVMTLLLAGHETTANALTWAFYLLSQHPEAAARLHQEVDTVLGAGPLAVEDLPRLTYTGLVIDETLRLYPPAYSVGRLATAADEMMGYRIPARASVFTSSYVTHRLPEFWPEPDRFDPERFTPERSEGRHRFAYFPFGGGPRLCIGNNFALTEARILLAAIARRYDLRLVPGHPVAMEPLITLRPRHGMRMTRHRRQAAR